MVLQTFAQYFSEHSDLFKPGSRLLLACSGGPDSVALMEAAKALSDRVSFFFEVGHVNHKLRGQQSDDDARFVQKLAGSLHWPCHIRVRPIRSKSGNLEERARVQRYEALHEIASRNNCQAIVTAHHLDDQAETIFMNLLRGAGPDGLGGMVPARRWPDSGIYLCRPFLNLERAEILTFLKKIDRPFRKDRSNLDRNFQRNWLRLELFPRIEARAPGFKTRLVQLGKIFREEASYWEKKLEGVEVKVMRRHRAGQLLDFEKLLRYPAAVQRRFLRRAVGKDLLSFDGVEGFRRWMQSPPSSGRTWQLKQGWVAERLSKSKGSPSAKLFWLRQVPIKTPKRPPAFAGKIKG